MVHALLLPHIETLMALARRASHADTTPTMIATSPLPTGRHAAAVKRAQAAMQRALKQPDAKLPKRGQVVDMPPTADTLAPTDSPFLAEHNTHVEKQTRSRHASAHYKNVLSEPQRADPADAQRGTPIRLSRLTPHRQNGPQLDTQPPDGHPVRRLQGPQMQQRQRLALRLDPSLGQFTNRAAQPEIVSNSEQHDEASGSQEPAAPSRDVDAGTPDLAHLIPSMGSLARLEGGPSNDALQSIDVGEGTFLNAREFKYASFFNRLKRSVAQRWDPLLEVQRRDPTGNIYGWRARMTTVLVSLDQLGALQQTAVEQSCGVDFLDQEAVAAFERAAPFPNPPSGLADTQGNIRFLFNFHVDFHAAGGIGGHY